jgi:hypothetical protein
VRLPKTLIFTDQDYHSAKEGLPRIGFWVLQGDSQATLEQIVKNMTQQEPSDRERPYGSLQNEAQKGLQHKKKTSLC